MATETKVSAFQVFLRMQQQDDHALQLAPLSNIINARKVKAGTQITIGFGGDVCGKITLGELVGGLILVDKKRYEEVKAGMEAALRL